MTARPLCSPLPSRQPDQEWIHSEPWNLKRIHMSIFEKSLHAWTLAPYMAMSTFILVFVVPGHRILVWKSWFVVTGNLGPESVQASSHQVIVAVRVTFLFLYVFLGVFL